MRENDPLVEIKDVYVRKETNAALLCLIDEKEVWIPKSQIHPDSPVSAEDDSGTLIISEWIATQKGLV